MPGLRPTQIEVYLFRRRGRRVEFLCLKRSPTRRTLPGVWQPLTGGLRSGETPFAGARREVREETGLEPRRWWALEGVQFYFDAPRGRAQVMAVFAAEVGVDDPVRLSSEHTAFEYLGAPAAGRRFLWEAQRRGLDSVRREILRGGMLARALELTPKPKAARRRTR